MNEQDFFYTRSFMARLEEEKFCIKYHFILVLVFGCSEIKYFSEWRDRGY